ncbi:hypothetical protein [Xenophilus sp. Marseille-Q4582]|uniref:hypothetical protein n=1 Tax=Xenophilus sp. Marseille-Q4582 TaxID=2866600 RepID=UPI001CE3F10E|nr:hypothetical protein [Xenophilus sp. Marseille-Q4582]
MIRLVVLAFGALALSGCVGMMKPPPPPVAKVDVTENCLTELHQAPKYEPLRSKVSLSKFPQRATLAMFADQTKPTEAEKALLSQLDADRNACFEAGREFRNYYVAGNISAEYQREYSEVTRLTAQIYNGELTYGQYNTKRAEIADAADARRGALLESNRKAVQELQDRIDSIGQKSRTSCRRVRGGFDCETD